MTWAWNLGMEVERRAVVRYLCDRQVTYRPLLTRERLRARVRNISVDGIGLLLSDAIDRGTEIAIELQSLDPDIPLTLVARVVHATRESNGSWLVGCKFLTRPTEEHLLALL
jgi:c-di-GMP-binding flagellar brake protein YcgR